MKRWASLRRGVIATAIFFGAIGGAALAEDRACAEIRDRAREGVACEKAERAPGENALSLREERMMNRRPGWAEKLEATFILNVDSVGVLRGSRSRDLNPSVTAIFELEYDIAYGGVVATPTRIQGELRPLVLGYAGVTPDIAGVDWNVGGRYFSFPDSSNFKLDFDGDGMIDFSGRKGFFEGFVGVKKDFGPASASARAFYAPDSFGQSGPEFYLMFGGEADLFGGWKAKAHGGRSRAADKRINTDFWDYAFGVYGAFKGFDLYIRYSDRAGRNRGNNDVVVFGVERAFPIRSSPGPRDPSDHDRFDAFVRDRRLFDLPN